MTIKIEELSSSDQYLVNVTDTELNEISGGYFAYVNLVTGNPAKATATAVIVNGRFARDSEVQRRQRDVVGLTGTTIATGIAIADVLGGGVFLPAATAAKLEG